MKKRRLLLVGILVFTVFGILIYPTLSWHRAESENVALNQELTEREERIRGLEEQVELYSDLVNVDRSELLTLVVGGHNEIGAIKNEILYWHNCGITDERAEYKSYYIYIMGEMNDIDPLFLTSVGIVESDLTHTENGEVVKSGENAKGIFQLTDIVYNKYDIDPEVFEENVKGAVLFISHLKERYEEDLTAVLGHYNGGENPYYNIENYTETSNFVWQVNHIYESLKERVR